MKRALEEQYGGEEEVISVITSSASCSITSASTFNLDTNSFCMQSLSNSYQMQPSITLRLSSQNIQMRTCLFIYAIVIRTRLFATWMGRTLLNTIG